MSNPVGWSRIKSKAGYYGPALQDRKNVACATYESVRKVAIHSWNLYQGVVVKGQDRYIDAILEDVNEQYEGNPVDLLCCSWVSWRVIMSGEWVENGFQYELFVRKAPFQDEFSHPLVYTSDWMNDLYKCFFRAQAHALSWLAHLIVYDYNYQSAKDYHNEIQSKIIKMPF